MNDEYLRQCLDVIKTIEGYPYDEKKDAEMLADRIAEFPTIDILSLLRRWKTRIYDFPFAMPCQKRQTTGRCSCRPTCKSSPRSQFLTWCIKAAEWGQNQRITPNTPMTQVPLSQEVPSVAEQIRRQNERAAQRRAELGLN